jgi:hypothetical protein
VIVTGAQFLVCRFRFFAMADVIPLSLLVFGNILLRARRGRGQRAIELDWKSLECE